jgi:hypothetical protein
MLSLRIGCSGKDTAAPSDGFPVAVLFRAIGCSGEDAAAPSDGFPVAVLFRAIGCSGKDAAAPSGDGFSAAMLLPSRTRMSLLFWEVCRVSVPDNRLAK